MRRENVALTNYAVLFVSIMEFKAINTLYGAEAGEKYERYLQAFFAEQAWNLSCARERTTAVLFSSWQRINLIREHPLRTAPS